MSSILLKVNPCLFVKMINLFIASVMMICFLRRVAIKITFFMVIRKFIYCLISVAVTHKDYQSQSDETVNLFCYILGEPAENQQLMRCFIRDLRLNFHFFQDLFLLGVALQFTIIGSVNNNVNTSYRVENMQLSFDLSIKRTQEFERHKRTY